ncbi:hypothetical protein E9Q_01963 [Moraxella catarrhalis BC1]|nr:hypothetical protein E9Q_01963 [Moraxella catarrhalis BC1]
MINVLLLGVFFIHDFLLGRLGNYAKGASRWDH